MDDLSRITSIQIHEDTLKDLSNLGTAKDSYEDVIKRLIAEVKRKP